MSILGIIAFACFILFLVVAGLGVKGQGFDTPVIELNQIPEVFARLSAEGEDGSFATIMFQPPRSVDSNDAINIQFSVENGRIGLDWCLIAPSNIRDEKIFEQFVTSLGHKVEVREVNEVRYLRIEEGDDLPLLCQKIIRDLYAKHRDSKLDLIVQGFPWP